MLPSACTRLIAPGCPLSAQVDLCVHHGGAGTTQAVLLAGACSADGCAVQSGSSWHPPASWPADLLPCRSHPTGRVLQASLPWWCRACRPPTSPFGLA